MALLGMGVMGGRDCLRTEAKRKAAIKKLIESGSKGRSLSARCPYSLATVGKHISERKAKIPPGMLEGMSDDAIYELVEQAKVLNDAIKAYKRTHRTRTTRKSRSNNSYNADLLASVQQYLKSTKNSGKRRRKRIQVYDEPDPEPVSLPQPKRRRRIQVYDDNEGDGLIYPALY